MRRWVHHDWVGIQTATQARDYVFVDMSANLLVPWPIVTFLH